MEYAFGSTFRVDQGRLSRSTPRDRAAPADDPPAAAVQRRIVGGRWVAGTALLVAGTLVLAIGVAVYLDAQLGAGPAEALALAAPVSFRTSYVLLQAIGATSGWILGADIGPGTLLVMFGVGLVVGLLRQRFGKSGPQPSAQVIPDAVSSSALWNGWTNPTQARVRFLPSGDRAPSY